MNEFIHYLKDVFSSDNVTHWPYPCGDGQWRTYDLNRYNSYKNAVAHSKEHSLPKVVVKVWNEATQEDVYAKTYWQ